MPRLIIVEDAQIIREPLLRLLKAEGFEVASAADGAEAMAILDSQGADLVLLDVLMPRMNGVAFMEALRSLPRHRELPVIGVTGVSDTAQLTRLRQLGVKTILHKVRFTFDGLLAEIRLALAEADPAGGARQTCNAG